MTDTSHDDHQLIRQYLAERLSEEEELVLMTRIIHDPRFRREVDVTAALREGFRELERRGRLGELLQPPAGRRPRVPLALAAAVVAAVSGGVISYFVNDRQHAPAPAVQVETLRFETTRGDAARTDVTWNMRGRAVQLEMVFDVGPSPAGSYRVTLRHSTGTQFATIVDQVIEIAPDGEVALLLDGALLTQGHYDVRLEPLPAGLPGAIVSYTLTVQDGPDGES